MDMLVFHVFKAFVLFIILIVAIKIGVREGLSEFKNDLIKELKEIHEKNDKGI
jgi:hypothetical protein